MPRDVPNAGTPITPHNDAAEMALLGAILHSNRAFERVADFLQPAHFSSRVHGRIFEAIAKLIDRGQIADPITLKQYFEADSDLVDVGGFDYLMRLAGSVASITNAEDYGRTVHDLHLRRELIALGSDIVSEAYKDDLDNQGPAQIEAAEERLFRLAESGTESTEWTFAESLKATLATTERAYKHTGSLVGAGTGLIDLDRLMGGLHPSDLVILAGRPSMGKTALATNIAFRVAKTLKDGKPQTVAFFSLEMSAEQLTARILSEQSDIPSERIRRGELSSVDFENLEHCARDLDSLPLVIDDGAALSIHQLRNRARRIKRRQKGLALIVVDYLQLMRGEARERTGNRVEVVSEITRGLKGVAKELDVPVLALSQLSRALESRDDKRPQLSDLRESGSIEQDADVVMFVYRDEYYLARKEPPENTPEHAAWDEAMEKVHALAELLLAKQRHGPIGKVTLHFNDSLTKFSNHAPSRWR